MIALTGSKAAPLQHIHWMASAVGISALGMAYHTISEFGIQGIRSFGSGFIPFVGMQLLMLVLWWASSRSRGAIGIALMLTGILQLIGGALISVLPLTFLPFMPEQSLNHYAAHAVYGIAQIPQIVLPLRIRTQHGGRHRAEK